MQNRPHRTFAGIGRRGKRFEIHRSHQTSGSSIHRGNIQYPRPMPAISNPHNRTNHIRADRIAVGLALGVADRVKIRRHILSGNHCNIIRQQIIQRTGDILGRYGTIQIDMRRPNACTPASVRDEPTTSPPCRTVCHRRLEHTLNRRQGRLFLPAVIGRAIVLQFKFDPAFGHKQKRTEKSALNFSAL